MEVGAGTFHPDTFLRAIGPEPWAAAHAQPSRRPTDGRYGENPNRLQHYYQYQVAIKPSPLEIQNWYVDSLIWLGIDPLEHDIRFVEDNWESPTLGAWGLGWEVWLNGMEINAGSPTFSRPVVWKCKPVTAGDRLRASSASPCISRASTASSIWCGPAARGEPFSYGDVFLQNETEMSAYNFEHADTIGRWPSTSMRSSASARNSQTSRCRARPTTWC